MAEINWNEKYGYLSSTRWLYYNDDYLKFLVRDVWQITRPVNIIDFGCGYGFLGVKLLPMLPIGSTYVGVDQASSLIEQARDIFEESGYDATFRIGSIEAYEVECNYDIALCHALMLHMTDPEMVLKKMIGSVVNDGKVICFEPNWIANMSNMYMDGTEQSEIADLGILQKLYEQLVKGTAKDGNVGIKLPVMMSKLGLKDVACRMSDRVNFVDQNMPNEDKDQMIKSLLEDGVGSKPKDKIDVITRLEGLGLAPKAAEKQYSNEQRFEELFNDGSWLTYAPSMKISFGRVER